MKPSQPNKLQLIFAVGASDDSFEPLGNVLVVLNGTAGPDALHKESTGSPQNA